MDIVTAKDLIRVRRLVSTGAARAIREGAGLSYGELAKEAGVDKSSVFRWERGLRRPRGEAAARYLAALDELTSA